MQEDNVLNVYILTDLEGVAGVVYPEQIEAGTPAYEQARRLLTGEVNAAVEGALAGGAREVVVLDAHGASGVSNFALEELHPGAQYIIGARPSMLVGMDGSFDALLMLGFHPRAGTVGGVFDHTMSHERWLNFHCNGRLMGEIGIFAAHAGEMDVPVAMVSGDWAACEEGKALLGDIEVAPVKGGFGRHCARTLPPSAARDLIRQASENALKKLGRIRPFKVSTPVELAVEYVSVDIAGSVPLTEGRTRIDSRTVGFPGDTFSEAFAKTR